MQQEDLVKFWNGKQQMNNFCNYPPSWIDGESGKLKFFYEPDITKFSCANFQILTEK